MRVVESAVGQALLAAARAQQRPTADLLADLDLSHDELDDLLSGRRSVDPSLAEALALALGQTAEFWAAVGDDARRVARRVESWRLALDEFGAESLKALRDRGHVSATRKNPALLAEQLAAFFDSSPDDEWLTGTSFWQSAAHPVRDDSVRVWLRLARMQADYVAELKGVPTLDREELRLLLPDLVRVGTEKPAAYFERVSEQLADSGVVLVVQPDVPGTRLSGASWQTTDDRGVVALTLRRNRDDFLWWTVYHECAHLLLGHGLVVDSAEPTGTREDAANRLARELLLPRGWDVTLPRPSKRRVSALASRLGVPAGVLVGQLQHQGRVEQKDMNGLKEPTPESGTLEVRPVLGGVSGGPAWDAAMEKLLRDDER